MVINQSEKTESVCIRTEFRSYLFIYLKYFIAILYVFYMTRIQAYIQIKRRNIDSCEVTIGQHSRILPKR